MTTINTQLSSQLTGSTGNLNPTVKVAQKTASSGTAVQDTVEISSEAMALSNESTASETEDTASGETAGDEAEGGTQAAGASGGSDSSTTIEEEIEEIQEQIEKIQEDIQRLKEKDTDNESIEKQILAKESELAVLQAQLSQLLSESVQSAT